MLLLAMISIILGCRDCVTGAGEVQNEDRLLQTFTAIELNCGADIIIRHKSADEKNNVIVQAQPNLLPLITTKISGNALEIDIEGCTKTTKPIVIFVNIDKLDKIINDGSGNIRCDEELVSEAFEIVNNGSGNVTVQLRTNDLEVHLNGSGVIQVSGNANKVDIDHNGSGSIEALSLEANEGEVNLNGSGTVTVFATKEMNLELNGSGSIYYGGKPEKLNTKKNGSGEIHEAQ